MFCSRLKKMTAQGWNSEVEEKTVGLTRRSTGYVCSRLTCPRHCLSPFVGQSTQRFVSEMEGTSISGTSILLGIHQLEKKPNRFWLCWFSDSWECLENCCENSLRSRKKSNAAINWKLSIFQSLLHGKQFMYDENATRQDEGLIMDATRTCSE